MTTKTPSTLIIADSHDIAREGVASFCRARPDLALIGQCGNGQGAFEMILTLQPDFAILNFGMPKLNGLEVLCRLREVRSTTRVVLLSMSRDPATIGEAFRSGADGYVLKDEPSQDIFDAKTFDETVIAVVYIREGGRQYLTPVLRSEFVDGKEAQWASLSKRELEIFSLLVEGVRPRDIAKSLQISPKTVDTHRSHVMRKLEIGSVVGLVRFAIQHNLTPVAP